MPAATGGAGLGNTKYLDLANSLQLEFLRVLSSNLFV